MLPTPEVAADDRVYEPSEDSFLLLDCFEQSLEQLQQTYKNPVVCEIGSGSGVVTAFLKMHVFPKALFLATDLNPTACSTVLSTIKKNEPEVPKAGVVSVLQMSLAEGIRKNSIDILVFNPPYVPAEEVPEVPKTDEDYTWLDLALLGGSDGMVVTWQLLDRLDEYLTPNGVAYILFCARNKPDEVAKVMESRGWTVETVIHRKAGWEVLSVLSFRKDSQGSI
ncbi:hypothetical protein FT663_02244 [Candidozyma haemuli var. vulneris]|uniref:Methyltransferase small domain-containing protein n=1 Tax=Candidozyma haemuli TaxID=45357 RepID=A0A2V1AWI4_9ASCO|nr:hypothetical protein CXQ85_000200 [[Candida] haemuloni]KAF3992591.1 hypothetical protein FT663_02244 [[Candida] haemuloni var. vulneris]KAF3992643.1 hypothetical protein FT662_01024 [[Candida] haemuloni var. vulneris]PVH21231.1 hypothetical protein CXQ85_000200 [[Candida] haemuloni]